MTGCVMELFQVDNVVAAKPHFFISHNNCIYQHGMGGWCIEHSSIAGDVSLRMFLVEVCCSLKKTPMVCEFDTLEINNVASLNMNTPFKF